MKILYKWFIKDYKDVKNPKVREKYGLLAGIVGILSNIILSILKLVIGLIVNSVSLLGDALNNMGDTFSSLVNIFSFKINNKPADKKHPYGHSRSEYVGGLIISFIIIVIALELMSTSIDKIINPSEVVIAWYLWLILGLNIIIKLFTAILYKNSSKQIDSISLYASYKDSLNDILTTLIVIIGLYTSKYLNFNLDGYLGLALSVFIIVSGIKLIKQAIDKLLGEAIDEATIFPITQTILENKEIYDIHDVLAHQYGEGKIFMSVHAEMDAELSLMKAHEIVDTIERNVKRDFNVELLIHIDPIEFNNEELLVIKRIIQNTIEEIDYALSAHDIRISEGNEKRLYFDLAIPYEYMDRSKELVDYLIKKLSKKCKYKISIEINYQ